MDLYYFETPTGNFGDDLNTFLWDDLLPGYRDVAPGVTLFGVGTVLSDRRIPQGRVLVVGSGAGYSAPPDVGDTGKWDIRAVRGPRTAALLGLPPEYAVVDPAAMLPRLPRFVDVPRTGDVLFMPHWQTMPDFDWIAATRDAGIVCQMPTGPCEDVIRRIAGASAVIAESMHAAIIADAFGVPWTVAEVGGRFNHFKWADWAESLGVTLPRPRYWTEFGGLTRPRPRRFFLRARLQKRLQQRAHAAVPWLVPASKGAVLDRFTPAILHRQTVRDLRAAARGPFALSDRGRLAERQDRLAAILAKIRRDYGMPEA